MASSLGNEPLGQASLRLKNHRYADQWRALRRTKKLAGTNVLNITVQKRL